MKVSNTNIEGVKVFQPDVFKDDRGEFMVTFNASDFFHETGCNLVQENQSKSKKGVLRGLHYQLQHAQGKLVSVSKGWVWDVVVDIRPDSRTFGQFIIVQLNQTRNEFLWVPPGLAHGFLAGEDDTIFNYKCSDYYHPEVERTLQWNDPTINIPWDNMKQHIEGEVELSISDKDQQGLSFKDCIVEIKSQAKPAGGILDTNITAETGSNVDTTDDGQIKSNIALLNDDN